MTRSKLHVFIWPSGGNNNYYPSVHGKITDGILCKDSGRLSEIYRRFQRSKVSSVEETEKPLYIWIFNIDS